MKTIVLKRCFLAILMILTLSHCKKDLSDTTPAYPPPSTQDKENWLKRMNNEVVSLKNIVDAIMNNDAVTTIKIDSNNYIFEFANNPSVSFSLDNANYPAPLIGAHKIDGKYFWTRINGTGTSATVLLKDASRSNYEIQKNGITPQFDINEKGAWVINVDGQSQALYDPEGKDFRAIGAKALFSNVTFDLDSNVTISTNEEPSRQYVLPRFRPFTFLLSLPSTGTLKIASGFAIPLDFQQSGIESFEFKTPKEWSASYEFSADGKSGVIKVTSPTGMESDFEEKGILEIIAKNKYGNKLIRKVPVECEVGLVNYASVTLTNKVTGVDITGATFTFSESFTSKNTKDVTAIKANETFRLMLPDGFPELRKIAFTTTSGNFDYYFAPGTSLTIGDQNLSIAAPKALSFWQGGILVKINETQPLTGINNYKITGKILHLQIGPKVPWFPNGNIDVTTANSTTDGPTNTKEIIKALGGNGTSANYIARWPIRIVDGGFEDWYLGAVADYEILHATRNQNKTLFDQAVSRFNGTVINESTHTVFWTSTNINKTIASVYDLRRVDFITTGTKIYGCYGLAFRDIK
jgi:hypothetical protein